MGSRAAAIATLPRRGGSGTTVRRHVTRALGTTVELLVHGAPVMRPARRILAEELARIDAAASRFRADSEITALNASGGRPVEVSAPFAEALAVALRAAELSDGAVDPTVGAALCRIGYDRDFAAVTYDGPVLVLLPEPVSGWRCIRLDLRRRTVIVPPGVQLDLGATAKALAADRAASRIAEATGAGVLVSLGGDVAIAGPPPVTGWQVGVAERAGDHSCRMPVIALAGGGLATSGPFVRSWRRGGVVLHHIVDPATGLPAPRCWRTVTVAAASCVDANTAATAAIVLGGEAPDWLAARSLPARLESENGRVVTVGGWGGAPANAARFEREVGEAHR